MNLEYGLLKPWKRCSVRQTAHRHPHLLGKTQALGQDPAQGEIQAFTPIWMCDLGLMAALTIETLSLSHRPGTTPATRRLQKSCKTMLKILLL